MQPTAQTQQHPNSSNNNSFVPVTATPLTYAAVVASAQSTADHSSSVSKVQLPVVRQQSESLKREQPVHAAGHSGSTAWSPFGQISPTSHSYSASPAVGSSVLVPPFRSPVPRESAECVSLNLSVGMYLNVFNAANKCYEPCLVENVFPDGSFDASNGRGELYQRIDSRYVQCGSGSAGTSNTVSPLQMGSFPFAPAYSPVRPRPTPAAAAVQVQAFHTPTTTSPHQPTLSSSAQPSPRVRSAVLAPKEFKIGARVEALHSYGPSAPEQWVAAIVIKRLSPEIYTVYLEESGVEATLVVGRMRVSDQSMGPLFGTEQQALDRSGGYDFLNMAASGMVGPPMAVDAEGSLAGSLDDDELLVVDSSSNFLLPDGGLVSAEDLGSCDSLVAIGGVLDTLDISRDTETQRPMRPKTAPSSKRSVRSHNHAGENLLNSYG